MLDNLDTEPISHCETHKYDRPQKFKARAGDAEEVEGCMRDTARRMRPSSPAIDTRAPARTQQATVAPLSST